MIHKIIKWSFLGLVLCLAASTIVIANQASNLVARCKTGQHMSRDVQYLTFSRSQYPHIVAHIELSWRHGYPKNLKINRKGAQSRRSRLLYRWQKDHPQPVGDHKDLDEAPAAALRDEVAADVEPIDEHENRSAGNHLRQEISDLCDGQRVRYRFIAFSSTHARGDV
jgi:hypothetical protein